MIHLTLLRWIDPEDIVLQALTRSTRRPRTKCSLNGRVLRIVLVPVRNLNVVWDSAAKGANRAEGVCLLSMRRPMLSLKRDSVVVVDSLSAGFVMSVTSDVALALCSDGVGSILIVLALGVWSGSTKVTTGSLIPLATGSFSVVRDSTTVTFSLSIALETLFVMSSLEKPRRVTSSSWESARNKLVNAFQFEVLLALVPSLASSALSFVNWSRLLESLALHNFFALSITPVSVTTFHRWMTLRQPGPIPFSGGWKFLHQN